MDLFHRAKAIRLRCYNDKYLYAEDDEERVFQHRNGSTRQARWQVELVAEGQHLFRLKSCYGKYLSASNEPFLLGVTGRKVVQAPPSSRLDSSLEWEPIRDGFQVKLKTRYGHFLRANGGPPPWRNTVTHDIPHLHHNWILWEVDIVEIRTYTPASVLATESVESSPSINSIQSSPLADKVDTSPRFSKQESFSSSSSSSPHKSFSSPTSDTRTIHYMVANNDGYVEAGSMDYTFNFEGNSVEELTQKLEEEIELGHILLCSKNPVNGKLYPLRLHLPPNKKTMNVVVLLATSKAAKVFANESISL